jgi:hypothetical protein
MGVEGSVGSELMQNLYSSQGRWVVTKSGSNRGILVRFSKYDGLKLGYFRAIPAIGSCHD